MVLLGTSKASRLISPPKLHLSSRDPMQMIATTLASRGTPFLRGRCLPNRSAPLGSAQFALCLQGAIARHLGHVCR
jgi:hypothetical protein